MSRERETTRAHNGPQAEVEVEYYPGNIEWHRLRDGNGRLFRLGLIELTDRAGERFLSGANSRYKLVVLLDINGIGQAYPFKVGNGEDQDYLSPEYVHEKLGRALYGKRDVLSFTEKLGLLLRRPTTNGGSDRGNL